MASPIPAYKDAVGRKPIQNRRQMPANFVLELTNSSVLEKP